MTSSPSLDDDAGKRETADVDLELARFCAMPHTAGSPTVAAATPRAVPMIVARRSIMTSENTQGSDGDSKFEPTYVFVKYNCGFII